MKAQVQELEKTRGDLMSSYGSIEVNSFETMKLGGQTFEVVENGTKMSYRFHNENWQQLSPRNGKWMHYEGPVSKLQTRLMQQNQLKNGVITDADVLYKSAVPSRFSRIVDKVSTLKRPDLRAFREQTSGLLAGMKEHWPYIIVPAILGNKEFVDAKSRRIMQLFLEKDLQETSVENTTVTDNSNEVSETSLSPLTPENIKNTKKTIAASSEAIGYWEEYIANLRKTLPADKMAAADELQKLVDEIKPTFEQAKSEFENATDGSPDQAESSVILQQIVAKMEEVNKAFIVAAGGDVQK
jgi:hypothetical protein